jgi:nitroimidazol reductase NimA-like FMN-containing flavoprotein (pyridoxamine 5'-phosphate oxidase superfamily)
MIFIMAMLITIINKSKYAHGFFPGNGIFLIKIMFGKLDAAQIEEVLHHQIVGRIGCYTDGTTYVVPISFTYDGQYIYAHTSEGMKVNIMRKNPKVCFQTDRMQDMGNWQSVIAWGEYEELNDPGERAAALEKLFGRVLPIVSSETTHLSDHWPFPSTDLNNIKGIVFRIKLAEKTGRYEKITLRPIYAS